MKKILLSLLGIVISVPVFAQIPFDSVKLQESITLLHGMGMTKYDNIEEYGPQNYMRRDEVAKMFIEFGRQFESFENRTQVSEIVCDFSDLYEAHFDLKPYIRTACIYQLFKGYNNQFMPTKNISNAEFIAVLMRSFIGYQDETHREHRAYNYRDLGRAYNIIIGVKAEGRVNLNAQITRGDAAIMFYNAYNHFYCLSSGAINNGSPNCPGDELGVSGSLDQNGIIGMNATNTDLAYDLAIIDVQSEKADTTRPYQRVYVTLQNLGSKRMPIADFDLSLQHESEGTIFPEQIDYIVTNDICGDGFTKAYVDGLNCHLEPGEKGNVELMFTKLPYLNNYFITVTVGGDMTINRPDRINNHPSDAGEVTIIDENPLNNAANGTFYRF